MTLRCSRVALYNEHKRKTLHRHVHRVENITGCPLSKRGVCLSAQDVRWNFVRCSQYRSSIMKGIQETQCSAHGVISGGPYIVGSNLEDEVCSFSSHSDWSILVRDVCCMVSIIGTVIEVLAG